MTFPSVPRTVSVEAFMAAAEGYAGGSTAQWRTVTSDVRESAGVSIRRGRASLFSTTSPTTLNFTLGNDARHGDGVYAPLDPMSPWYGHFRRGTPIRATIDDLLYDDFDRTVSNSLGNTPVPSPSGYPYTLTGTAANFDVAAGSATILVAPANTVHRAYLEDLDMIGDCEWIAEFTMTDPASGNDRFGLTLRATAFNVCGTVDVDITAAGVVRLTIVDTGGVAIAGPTTIDGLTGGGDYTMHMLVEGSTIRGKIYETGDPEPYDWQISAIDPTLARIGWPGLRCLTGVGNTNVTYTIHALRMRFPR